MGMKEREDLQATLAVNNSELELIPFISDFVARVTVGIVLSLKGVDDVERANIELKGDQVKVWVNGRHISTNAFASKIIKATITGMTAVLKGGGDIQNLVISVGPRNE